MPDVTPVPTPAQLPDELYAQITALSHEGDALAKAGEFESAKLKYLDAFRILPPNHKEWEAATWLYVAIGDANFHMQQFDRTFKCFINAVQCPGGLGNPFIHLRLGQAYYELRDFDKAADELTRAYMGAGIGIFMEDDPKYLEFLETKIEI